MRKTWMMLAALVAFAGPAAAEPTQADPVVTARAGYELRLIGGGLALNEGLIASVALGRRRVVRGGLALVTECRPEPVPLKVCIARRRPRFAQQLLAGA